MDAKGLLESVGWGGLALPDLGADASRREEGYGHPFTSFHDGCAEPVWEMPNGVRFVYEDHKGQQRFYGLEIDGRRTVEGGLLLGGVDEDHRGRPDHGMVEWYAHLTLSPAHYAPNALGYPSATLEPDLQIGVPYGQRAWGAVQLAIAVRALYDAHEKFRELFPHGGTHGGGEGYARHLRERMKVPRAA